MQSSMHFRRLSAIWPTKVVVIFLIIMALSQTSVGYVGTSDSTIFYFGDNSYGENGKQRTLVDYTMMDVRDVSLLRSTSCGGHTTVFLYDNNTVISQGKDPVMWAFGTGYPHISSVSSIRDGIMYSLTSDASIYVCGGNPGTLMLNDLDTSITEPTLSPPRLNEAFRYCATQSCLAFSRFPPGSTTSEPVIHEPDIPLFKFIGAWCDLSNGHLGNDPIPVRPTPGTYYKGPDLIVKKVSMSTAFSIFILHNNTVLVSGGAGAAPPTNGVEHYYLPIQNHPSVDPIGVKIVDASTSQSQALLLSEDHRVFFFGSNTYYASGIPNLGADEVVNPVMEVPFAGILYPDDYVIQIRAQYYRSSAITKMGFVYTWGSREANPGSSVQTVPTLENTFLQGRYAVRYLDLDDITKNTGDAIGSCILTRPRAGNCAGAPPTADYYCIGGLWTTRESGSKIPTLNISSPTEIDGNPTISGPLIINPQSSISVTQCLSVGSIQIVKQQGDDSPSQDIISTDKYCPDISGTAVYVIPTGKVTKCEKMTATLSKSEMSGRIVYSAAFTVNDNDCTVQNCTGNPPSVDFDCIGGLWTNEGGIETLTVSSPVEVGGNLTIYGSLVINPQSSILVAQCLSVGSIEIVKQQGDDSPSQDIISTGKNCPDISGTIVSVIPTGNVKKCEKKTSSLSKNETGERTTYSAIFKVNNNDCKRWWIILVSVLGGVVLLVIIGILVALPLWRRKHTLSRDN